MIPLRVHNIIDYIVAGILILSPFLFGFSDVTNGRNLFVVLGFVLAGYSVMTQYQYALAQIIPVMTHMFLDVLTGFVLMIGPYAFKYRLGISDGQTALHFVLGLSIWALVALTMPGAELIGKYSTEESDLKADRAA